MSPLDTPWISELFLSCTFSSSPSGIACSWICLQKVRKSSMCISAENSGKCGLIVTWPSFRVELLRIPFPRILGLWLYIAHSCVYSWFLPSALSLGRIVSQSFLSSSLNHFVSPLLIKSTPFQSQLCPSLYSVFWKWGPWTWPHDSGLSLRI